MNKTTSDIEQDIYNVAKDYLGGIIDGRVYKYGIRPKDSKQEDAVISVSFATAGQWQYASCYVNIFVPDIASGNGETLPDKSRIATLSALGDGLADAVCGLTDYVATLGSATDTLEAESGGQHIVSIHISLTINTI